MMDLKEFVEWLRAEMQRQGIPDRARIHYVDITSPRADNLQVEYNAANNSVRIVDEI
jgi:disulfide oxidoreductase YuzD